MGSSYIKKGMRVIRYDDLDKPDPEVGLCVGKETMGDERKAVISWPDGQETVHSVSELVPLNEDGKPKPLTGQINVSDEELESMFSDRLDFSGEDG